MPRFFAISQSTDRVQLDDKGRGEVSYTVTNIMGRVVRARASVTAQDKEAQSWVSVPEAEREFRDAGAQQFTAKVAVPPGAAAREYKFLFDVIESTDPEKNYEQGPPFMVLVKEAAIVKSGGKVPWWVFLLAGLAVVVIGGVAWWFMRSGGEERGALPMVTGISLDSAKVKLREAGFEEPVVSDTFTGTVSPGTVLRQEPPSDSLASSDTVFARTGEVKLWVEGEATQVPPLVGSPLGTARSLLTALGLRDTVVAESVTTTVSEGTVLRQEPLPDSLFARGGTVRLWVEGRSIPVPDVQNKNIQQAARDVQDVGLRIDPQGSCTTNASQNDLVISQRPLPPTRLPPLGEVTVFIGQFQDAPCRRFVVPLDHVLLEELTRFNPAFPDS